MMLPPPPAADETCIQPIGRFDKLPSGRRELPQLTAAFGPSCLPGSLEGGRFLALPPRPPAPPPPRLPPLLPPGRIHVVTEALPSPQLPAPQQPALQLAPPQQPPQQPLQPQPQQPQPLQQQPQPQQPVQQLLLQPPPQTHPPLPLQPLPSQSLPTPTSSRWHEPFVHATVVSLPAQRGAMPVAHALPLPRSLVVPPGASQPGLASLAGWHVPAAAPSSLAAAPPAGQPRRYVQKRTRDQEREKKDNRWWCTCGAADQKGGKPWHKPTCPREEWLCGRREHPEVGDVLVGVGGSRLGKRVRYAPERRGGRPRPTEVDWVEWS